METILGMVWIQGGSLKQVFEQRLGSNNDNLTTHNLVIYPHLPVLNKICQKTEMLSDPS